MASPPARRLVALLAQLRHGRGGCADNGHNVILVTLDGVRIQELFGGMDPVIANAPEAESGIYEIDVTRSAAGAKRRRRAARR